MTSPDRSAEAAFLAYRESRSPDDLARVYDLTAARLLAVALHLSSSEATAEDAVQDTFLFALEYPERWDRSRPLVPWLLGILGNLLKQSARRARRTLDTACLNLPDQRDPVSKLAADECLDHIERAIVELAQPYRTVVLLRLRNGLSSADIAVALGRKPSTVRAQLSRGVEMLRKRLPVAVTSLLVGSALAGRGLAAVRATVMERAMVVERALAAGQLVGYLRHVGIALAGVAVLAVMTWFVVTSSATPVTPHVDLGAELEVEGDVDVQSNPVELETRARVPGVDRDPVAVTGSLVVRVTNEGRSVGSARVILEPLGSLPCAFVHRTKGGPGEWSVIVSGRPAPVTAHRRGITAADGRSTFHGLSAGHWIVRAPGVDRVVEVEPGSEVEVGMPTRAMLVSGLVVDEDGHPVVDASIWACRAHVLRLSEEVARSDVRGRFAVAVAPDAMIGARAAGRACVGVTVADGAAGPRRDVVLRLSHPGAAVVGRIVDAAGQPIPGAVVQVGHAGDTRCRSRAPSPRVLARPVRFHADAEGRFRGEGLVPGVTWLAARAPGFGAAGTELRLDPASDAMVELTLPRAATIRGTVRAANGLPVAGASVCIGRRDSLAGCATTTGPDGRYRLTGVAPGRNMVVVLDHRGGSASRLHRCEAAEVVTWDPEFRADDLILRGRVLGRSSTPFAHGWVVHRSPVGISVQRLDEAGQFAIPVHERACVTSSLIQVFDHNPRQGGSIVGVPLAVADVAAGMRDVEVKLPVSPAPSAWVCGRFVDEIGVLASSPSVYLEARVGGRSQRLQFGALPADGRFRVGPFDAGRFSITVAGESQHRFGPFTASAGQDCELGELRVSGTSGVPQSGTRRHPCYFAFAWVEDVAFSEPVRVEVRDFERRLMLVKHMPGGVGGESADYVLLPAGRYVATATSASGMIVQREFEVTAERHPRSVTIAFDGQ